MFIWLNEKFIEWQGFESWQKIIFTVSIIFFTVPCIYGTWTYWAEILTNIPEDASFLTTMLLLVTFAVIYLIAFGVLAWIWAYVSAAVGVVTSVVLLPFIWLYRKICP